MMKSKRFLAKLAAALSVLTAVAPGWGQDDVLPPEAEIVAVDAEVMAEVEMPPAIHCVPARTDESEDPAEFRFRFP